MFAISRKYYSKIRPLRKCGAKQVNLQVLAKNNNC